MSLAGPAHNPSNTQLPSIVPTSRPISRRCASKICRLSETRRSPPRHFSLRESAGKRVRKYPELSFEPWSLGKHGSRIRTIKSSRFFDASMVFRDVFRIHVILSSCVFPAALEPWRADHYFPRGVSRGPIFAILLPPRKFMGYVENCNGPDDVESMRPLPSMVR